MKVQRSWILVLASPLLLAGPWGARADERKEPKIKANLAKLSPKDRKLAEAQKYCAVKTKNLLGSMGEPYKVMIKGQPVFLCCDGCEAKARANPDKTLAAVKKLKAKARKQRKR
jgi:hypothetical protein